MTSRSRLTLPEELLLLALQEREGTIIGGTHHTYALAGGILSELILGERVEAAGGGKHPKAKVRDRTPFGDPLLDEWLAKMVEREKPRTLYDWVGRMARTRDLKHRVALSLCRKGVLRSDEDKVLWIFTRKIYPEVDPGPEREARRRLESAVFGDSEEVDARTATLAVLAHHTGLLQPVFGKKRVKAAAGRIERIAAGDLAARATKQAIEAMIAATVAATSAATAVVITS